ncbi:uncharacterized protein LAESUDRAFT_761415 [Laetiporus sulphureus 93-53]|uniref:Uncharacterized protein n=1 Tax=Laetiporus sulphureus 93-53 TaxID=1314785 RepID=A0A165D359_9APHY|nr:uncharacterized protein LAESUDRAFT_761415 [Laetiporus sulphureus 93-53]KZT04065.1 hypothetical protein LAESUDRAFT_761415 [Laetiporus sulphureus 93-53]
MPSLSYKNLETVIETVSEPASSTDKLFPEILTSGRDNEAEEYELSMYDDATDAAQNEDSILHDLSAILPSHFSITREVRQNPSEIEKQKHTMAYSGTPTLTEMGSTTTIQTPVQTGSIALSEYASRIPVLSVTEHTAVPGNMGGTREEVEEAEEAEEAEVVMEEQDRGVIQEEGLAGQADWVAGAVAWAVAVAVNQVADLDQEEEEAVDQVDQAEVVAVAVADQDQVKEEEDKGQGKKLRQYFNDLAELAAQAGLTGDQRIHYVLRYLMVQQEELWSTVLVASTVNFALFKQQIFELYPEAEGDCLYTIADLEQCITEALARGIHTRTKEAIYF